MARAGLAYENLRVLNPSIVMCSISMAGHTGPLSQAPGFDYIAAAHAGAADQFGEADRGPALIPLAIGDSYTGVTAAMAICVALLHRERTGEGQYVEATLVDSWFHMEQVNVPRVSLRGEAALPVRAGSLHPDVCASNSSLAVGRTVLLQTQTERRLVSAWCRCANEPRLFVEPGNFE
jgi:CoA:oxalate CoA-transferase